MNRMADVLSQEEIDSLLSAVSEPDPPVDTDIFSSFDTSSYQEPVKGGVVDSRDVSYYKAHKMCLPAGTQIKVRQDDFHFYCSACGTSSIFDSNRGLLGCGHRYMSNRRRML